MAEQITKIIGLNNPVWRLSKSKYDETDELPLMSTPGPVLMMLAGYLLFVLKLGPALMRKREPYKLKGTLLVYNFVQVIVSAYLVHKYLVLLLRIGLLPKHCYMKNEEERKELLEGIWYYFAVKVTEFLDTIFFVFRKKYNQITFLHLYHHSVMMLGTWAVLKYWPSHTLVFIGFLNSLIHVFMYTYYGLAALGPNVAKYLTWKKYMTTMQLVQFVAIFIQYIITVSVSECPPSKAIAVFISLNTVFIMILFANFYRQSYTKRSKVASKELNGMPQSVCFGNLNDVKKEL